jgi:hypothetical protein
MEPVDSLPCSQETATGPYPEPVESNPHSHPITFKIDIILPSTPSSLK